MTDLQALAKQVDELASKDAIRECVRRVNRGIDRIDVALLSTAFHSDAQVQWMTPEPIPVDKWLGNVTMIREMTREAQHLIGQTLIELDGDTAKVESYELTRHLTKFGEEWKDMIYSARYLDKFSRRDGAWKIDFRVKIMDWGRIMEGSDGVLDHAPTKGVRGPEDLSYQMFGDKVFARPL